MFECPVRTALVAVGVFFGVVSHAEGSVNVTVYNDNFALIRDTRILDVTAGNNDVRISNVAAQIEPTSVLFSGDGMRVVEQNFEYDLADGDRILDRYIGREVTAVLEGGEVFSGTLLSYAGGGLVLTVDDRPTVLRRDRVDRIDFPELPEGLTTRPTLVWRLDSDRAGSREATLSYITSGLGWHAEYVAELNADDTAMSLAAWVSLDNRSGAAYEDARLQLVAGTIHRAPVGTPRATRELMAMDMAGKASFEEESFFEYHLYTLEDPVTIKDRQSKQLTLFPTAEVTEVLKRYTYRGGKSVDVEIVFENRESFGLGLPLPKGKVRLFKADSKGGSQMVGEDAIRHTPRDEKVELQVGSAFDITGERKVLEQRQIARRVNEQEVEIKLRNAKDEAVTVTVKENAYGDWEVLTSSHPFEKESATEFQFDISVPARSEVVVTYTLRTQV
jgi:hypothetical protein